MRRFLSDKLPDEAEMILLSAEQSHHMLRVVGISRGEHVVLMDGLGGVCEAALHDIEGGLARLRFVSAVNRQTQPVDIWFFLALTKPPAFSLSLRMLTEIGVAHVVPVITERSQNRSEKNDRWKRIILSALQQSGRQYQPTLHSLQSFDEALNFSHSLGARFVLQPNAPSLESTQSSCAAFIGPEGGFSESELTLLSERGWQARGLGQTTLRADTAAAVAAGILAFA
jgi:16S rRNA (uracil1498-N3)-methyltransferase